MTVRVKYHMNSNQKLKSGIYEIVNTLNGKRYIGSSQSMKRRWDSHKYNLKYNKHHSKYLQNSWNKYGEDCFKFNILEYCEVEKLLEREQFYLDTLKPRYNCSPTAKNCKGVKHNDPIANYKRGSYFRGIYGKDHPSSILVYQYDLEGNFLRKWFGAAEIERETGFSSANITKSCIKANKGFLTPYGFFWTREYLGPKIPPIKKRNRDRTCKKIGMFDENDVLIREFKSQKEACEFLKINSNSSINVILKNTHGHKTAYGYKWKYL